MVDKSNVISAGSGASKRKAFTEAATERPSKKVATADAEEDALDLS